MPVNPIPSLFEEVQINEEVEVTCNIYKVGSNGFIFENSYIERMFEIRLDGYVHTYTLKYMMLVFAR